MKKRISPTTLFDLIENNSYGSSSSYSNQTHNFLSFSFFQNNKYIYIFNLKKFIHLSIYHQKWYKYAHQNMNTVHETETAEGFPVY